MAESISGLYVITDSVLIPDPELCDRVRQAIQGGATAVQYRDKRRGYEAHLQRACALRSMTRELGVPLIINDNPRLALDSDADGVHLGRDDPDIASARKLLGGRIIGVSCYDDVGRAVDAEEQGADYVAFGSFYPTPTKTGTTKATPDLLQHAKRALGIPLVAIGGITPDNGSALIRAGADALAVVHAVFGSDDPRKAAERFMKIVDIDRG